MADASRPRALSVSALTEEIKKLLEGNYPEVFVKAEISGFKRYPSGHAYFTLKDEAAQISAVMFSSSFERCRERDSLKDGAKVVVRARLSVYAPRGAYQLVVIDARTAGQGELMRRYLELKSKLDSEGLFDTARKRPLPFLPRRIGIVSSEAGAVIHDMCTVLTRRFPALEIRLYPCLVQGDLAPQSIVDGIDYFQNSTWRADLLIIARGGGSFEDLFCFNDEMLVRKVASSSIPTISAVGHETDFTLCDFAADKRAGTPSIAAETAVPLLSDLAGRIEKASLQMANSLRGKGDFFAQRLDHLSQSLLSSLSMYRERLESRLDHACSALRLLSPYGVLTRGYSLTVDSAGSVVRDASLLHDGDILTTRFAIGVAKVSVVGTAFESGSRQGL